MEELKKLRERIDEIDKQIVGLFEKRMGVVLGVAEYKKTHNTGVLQTSREAEVLQKAVDNLEDKAYAPYVKQLMNEMMTLSKDLQNSKILYKSVLDKYKRLPLSCEPPFFGLTMLTVQIV